MPRKGKGTKTKKTGPSDQKSVSKAGANKSKAEKTKESSKTKKKTTEKKEKVVQEIVEVGADIEEEVLDEEEQKKAIEALKKEKWWLQEPWRTLLDPELAGNINLAKFDISKLIQEFTEKMIQEDLIDFRISGMAIYSSSVLYHKKITEVIDEEEKIERERTIQKLRREIPKSISQPLRQAQKVATAEELFDAMRRAIIETMQRREKLQKRRQKRAESKVIKKRKRSNAKLPIELLKHITGKEETVEELLNRWHQKAITMYDMNNKELTMDDIKRIIYDDDELELIQKKAKYIQAFQAMLFLMALNKVKLIQETPDSPIFIEIKDRSRVIFD